MSLKDVAKLEKFTLTILAKDFKKVTEFIDFDKCAIAIAAKRQMKVRYASEGVDQLDFTDSIYNPLRFLHKAYGPEEFEVDKLRAEKANSKGLGDKIIRKIKMCREK